MRSKGAAFVFTCVLFAEFLLAECGSSPSNVNQTDGKNNNDIDTLPPVVGITQPRDGASLSGTVTIVADASDNVGIKQVEFFIDGDKPQGGTASNPPYEYAWDTTTLPDSSVHSIFAKATDTSDNLALSDEIYVTVDNAPPPPLPSDARVIILVIDGARYTETFGDPIHTNIPFMWNHLKPLATLFTDFRNEGSTSTNPGHASIATGTWQYIANDGSERPDMPTFFEYLRKEFSVPKSETYLVAGKSKLDICSYSTHSGYGPAYGATSDVGFPGDATTFQGLKNDLQMDRPQLALVNFPSVDRAGHYYGWNAYVDAIKEADSLAYELWQYLESDTFYAGKTYLFVTNDHGRHDDDHGGFESHGDGCEGCRHIMLLALGPDIKQDYTVSATYTQIDLCPTVGAILGFSTPYAEGSVIEEMFAWPIHASP